MTAPDAIACTGFLLAAILPVGYAHAAWLKHARPGILSKPLDFGMTFRGRRIFGANKMFRGFVVIVPGGGLSFFLLSILGFKPWPLSPLQYGAVGICAGLGFMLAELPNSFLKRQFDIAPGKAPASGAAKTFCFVIDHIDSILGMLLATQLLAPVPPLTWAAVSGAGFVIHLFFSAVLFRLGIKARPL